MGIRHTKEEDLQAVMQLIYDAQEDFRTQGIDQWQRGYPNEEKIREDMSEKESYVLEDGEIQASTAISFRGEKNYRVLDGEWATDADTKYAVIHRIVTSRKYKRNGSAGKLLQFAEKLCKEQGVRSVRIDTHPDNLIMQNWIKKNGFVYCGHIWLEDGALRYAYEKVLTV